jgi:hypothetical protein
MKWLSFINGIAGILLILAGVSGIVSNHLAAAGRHFAWSLERLRIDAGDRGPESDQPSER